MTEETKALYDIETTTDSDGNIHLWAWVVKDQDTGERVRGKSKESFIEFLNRDMTDIGDSYIYSKSKDLLDNIK